MFSIMTMRSHCLREGLGGQGSVLCANRGPNHLLFQSHSSSVALHCGHQRRTLERRLVVGDRCSSSTWEGAIIARRRSPGRRIDFSWLQLFVHCRCSKSLAVAHTLCMTRRTPGSQTPSGGSHRIHLPVPVFHVLVKWRAKLWERPQMGNRESKNK